MKRLFYALLIAIVLLVFFGYKGWIEITPEGRKAASDAAENAAKKSKEVISQGVQYTLEEIEKAKKENSNK